MRKLTLILFALLFTVCFLTADEKVYNIGDIGPGGGIVFYASKVAFPVPQLNGETKMCHYLEVSPVNLVPVSWCYHDDGCNVNTSCVLGAGLKNTYNIISFHNDNASIKNCAAYSCSLYATTTSKAGEWFLPSKDELDLLYKNLGAMIWDSNTTGDNWYWSSSMDNNSNAWRQRFNDGNQYSRLKNYTVYSVRAVRAF